MTHRRTCLLLALSVLASTASAQERRRGTAERPARGQTAPAPAPSSEGKGPAAGVVERTGAGETGRRAQGGSRANRPGGAQAAPLGSFGDWTAYATPPGRTRICYALSQPRERSPKNVARDDAYLFVSIRPSENVRNEVAIMMGFPVKEPAPAEPATTDASAGVPTPAAKPPDQQLVIGSTRFAIAGKDENAWLADPAEEGPLVAAMARGQKLSIRAVSKRGSATTDDYSLKGFDDALRKAREECR